MATPGITQISPAELAEPKSSIWNPQPGPQTAAFYCKADILGYGGAAGGGKTDLLLGLASTKHIRSVIFRRESTQSQAMVDRSHEILGGIARFNSVKNIWSGIPGFRKIEFAGVKNPHDVMKWRGSPHDFIAIDEADSFQEFQVRFLMGWLRTTIVGQRCRTVLCFNPPATSDGRWLLQFFGPWLDKKHPHPAQPGELRWYATLKNGREVERTTGEPFEFAGELVTPKSRTFIPARVQDNKFLMATDYPSQLQSLPEPFRSQLLYGDFEAGLSDDPWQVIPTAWVEAAMERWESTPKPTPFVSAVGVDVARGDPEKGVQGDKTVIAKRYWNWFDTLEKHPNTDTPKGSIVASLVLKTLDATTYPANRDAVVNVDVLNCGTSAFDYMEDYGLNAVPINFGEGHGGHDKSGKLGFANVRAMAYWKMREDLDPESKLDICLPPDKELLADLTAARWTPVGTRIKIEEKKEIIKRLRRSPDCGDAVVLCNLEDQNVGAEGVGWSKKR